MIWANGTWGDYKVCRSIKCLHKPVCEGATGQRACLEEAEVEHMIAQAFRHELLELLAPRLGDALALLLLPRARPPRALLPSR